MAVDKTFLVPGRHFETGGRTGDRQTGTCRVTATTETVEVSDRKDRTTAALVVALAWRRRGLGSATACPLTTTHAGRTHTRWHALALLRAYHNHYHHHTCTSLAFFSLIASLVLRGDLFFIHSTETGLIISPVYPWDLYQHL